MWSLEPGLENTYDWVCSEAGASSTAANAAYVAAIAVAGDSLAKHAVFTMLRMLGAGIRNAALLTMSGEGVYCPTPSNSTAFAC